jgi:pSer/pThr/pTyr-binding forkhead associated (FHA) protein
MPTLVIRSPDGSEQEQQFEGELIIGRADGSGLVLSEGGVSRKHARVFVSGSQVQVEDLGSANGTYVDGEKIAGPTAITSASKVELGDYSIRLKPSAARTSGKRPAARPIEDPGGPILTKAMPSARKPGAVSAARAQKGPSAIAPAPDAGKPKPLQGPTLRGLTGPWLNKVYPLKGKVVIGRVAPAQVPIEDDSVSRRHAEVEVTPDGVIARDLGSANGTLHNGQALDGEMLLHPGDVLQVGMIELVFESDVPEVLNVPTRRAAGQGPGSSRVRPGLEAEPGSSGKKKLVLIGGGAVALLFAVGLVAKARAPKTGNDIPQVPTVDRTAEKQEYLTECRSFSSTDLGTEPDWGKAETACNHALDIDPINEEANRLIRKIAFEKEAASHFDQGQKEMLRLREDEALDQFGKIPQESYYYLKVKPKVVEVATQAKKRAGDDCKRYMRDRFVSEAYPRCERYMTFACQDMSNEELYPPLGYKLNVTGRLKKKQWKPKDAMYLLFLQAREKVKPDEPMWHCPPIKILAKPPAPIDNRTIVAQQLAKKYPDRGLAAAMLNYWVGSANDSLLILEKIRDDMHKAPLHAQADALRKDIADVDQLFRTGEGQLQGEDIDRAAIAFQEALQLDQKLMDDLALTRPSFYRKNMEQDISHQSFLTGKHWSDRGDPRRACGLFRTGFGFYKGDTDLNRAVGWCSTQGASALVRAETCQELQFVADVAMDGDGLKDKLTQRKQELKCP